MTWIPINQCWYLCKLSAYTCNCDHRIIGPGSVKENNALMNVYSEVVVTRSAL